MLNNYYYSWLNLRWLELPFWHWMQAHLFVARATVLLVLHFSPNQDSISCSTLQSKLNIKKNNESIFLILKQIKTCFGESSSFDKCVNLRFCINRWFLLRSIRFSNHFEQLWGIVTVANKIRNFFFNGFSFETICGQTIAEKLILINRKDLKRNKVWFSLIKDDFFISSGIFLSDILLSKFSNIFVQMLSEFFVVKRDFTWIRSICAIEHLFW